MRLPNFKNTPFGRSRLCKGCAIGLAAIGLGVGLYAAALQLTGNFHTVVEGQLYRIAQPSPAQMAKYAHAYGVRTIINLRGDNVGQGWYDREVKTAKELGLMHIDFRMSAKHELPQDRAIELITIMRDAPKPILIHCNGGSDRSGLASALYLAAIAQKGEFESESQLSIRFGHFSIPYLSPTYAMDRTFENMEPWLGFYGS